MLNYDNVVGGFRRSCLNGRDVGQRVYSCARGGSIQGSQITTMENHFLQQPPLSWLLILLYAPCLLFFFFIFSIFHAFLSLALTFIILLVISGCISYECLWRELTSRGSMIPDIARDEKSIQKLSDWIAAVNKKNIRKNIFPSCKYNFTNE